MIKVDFKWISEIGVEQIQKDGSNFIAIRLHIGDTKEQGRHFSGKSRRDSFGKKKYAVIR